MTVSRPAPQISAFFDEPTNTITYLVGDPETRRAAVIDPVLDFDPRAAPPTSPSAEAILAAASGEADDRVGAGDPCPCRPSVRRALHQGEDRRADRHRRAHQRRAADLPPGLQCRRPGPDGSDFDRLFADGETFAIGELDVEVLHTPGHTPACLSYKIGDAVFVGDTLFMPDYGTARADFPGGDARQLYRSMQRLLPLPRETRLFMCHDYKAPGRDDFAWETTVPTSASTTSMFTTASPKTSSSPCGRRATRRCRRRRCCCRQSR